MGGRKSGGWKRLVKRLALMRCGESKHQKPTLRAICRGFSLRYRWWAATSVRKQPLHFSNSKATPPPYPLPTAFCLGLVMKLLVEYVPITMLCNNFAGGVTKSTRIPHEERFSIPRIPAVVELCIQAGADLPEFPTKSEFIDADESELPDPVPEVPKTPLLTEIPDSEIEAPSSAEETALLAEETLKAWEKMKGGAKKLMRMYPVRVCGYCPEAGAAVPEQYKPTMRLDVGIPTYIKEAEMVV
ncbi:APO protein 2, chloroplastic [Vitis vinifera]|uniref:APO protein 2, chloroplastic n=1 Tax=Vitis vinifera TaxID=29760 RepID=A0A438IHG4_VITVI|nr:APO protein 2, chloroplastic [Vitis vinifera]